MPPTKPFIDAPDSERGFDGDCASGAVGFGGGSEDRCGKVGIEMVGELELELEVKMEESEVSWRRVPPQCGVKDVVYILALSCKWQMEMYKGGEK